MHHASRQGRVEFFRALYTASEDGLRQVHACDVHSLTPLHLCAFYDRLEFARELIAAGADLEAEATVVAAVSCGVCLIFVHLIRR
jgi:ankyrin repeat protein